MDATQAREQLQGLFRIFKSIQDADGILAVLEKAESLTKERQGAIELMTAELNKVSKQVTDAQADLVRVRQQAKTLVDQAKDQAAQILKDAKEKAKVLGDDAARAKDDAEMLKQMAAEALERVDAGLEAKRKELEALESAVASARETIEVANRIKSMLPV